MRPPEIAALPSMKGKDLDASLAKLTAGSGAEALVPRLTIVRQLGARLVDLERYTYLVNAIRPADTPPEQVARLGRYVDAYQLTFVDAVPRQAATRLFAEPQSIADAARLPIYVSATDPDSYALCLINEKTLIYGERNVVVAMLNQDPAAKQGYAGDALARGHLGLSMKFDRVPWPWNAMGVEPVTARLIEKNLDRSTAVAVLGTKPTAEVILTAKGRFSAATTAFALRAGVQDLRGKVGKLLEPPEGIPLPPAARPLVDAANKFGDDTVRNIEVRQEGLDVIVTLREFAELDDLLALVKSLRPLGPR